MAPLIQKPTTYTHTASPDELLRFFRQLFSRPEPAAIPKVVSSFLRYCYLPIDNFPRLDGTYSRNIIYRHDNGYEAMAARWSKGAITAIHGHPAFVFYHVIQGKLRIDNYLRDRHSLTPNGTIILEDGENFHAIGQPGCFDNSIHQVYADEETLSVHISSDDGAKGELFDERDIRTGAGDNPVHAVYEVSAG